MDQCLNLEQGSTSLNPRKGVSLGWQKSKSKAFKTKGAPRWGHYPPCRACLPGEHSVPSKARHSTAVISVGAARRREMSGGRGRSRQQFLWTLLQKTPSFSSFATSLPYFSMCRAIPTSPNEGRKEPMQVQQSTDS